jgi:hypothetical protein
LLGGFQIDDQLEFGRLLHREISRLRSSENLVDIPSGATPRILTTRAVRHKITVINKSTATIGCRQLVLSRKINYLLPAIYEERVWGVTNNALARSLTTVPRAFSKSLSLGAVISANWIVTPSTLAALSASLP